MFLGLLLLEDAVRLNFQNRKSMIIFAHYVAFDGPVTVPLIDYAPWLLNQGIVGMMGVNDMKPGSPGFEALLGPLKLTTSI